MSRRAIPGLFFTALLIGALVDACAAPWSPPTAAEILAKPSQSDMKDGHVIVKGHISSGAVSADVTGSGILVLKPHYAISLSLQGSIGALPFTLEELVIGEKSYSRVGSDKWTEQGAENEPANVVSGSRNPKLIGEETLTQGKAWHVRATLNSSNQEFDEWVRESDGYLEKYSASSDTGSLSMEVDKFNTGQTVKPPDAADIKPPAQNITGQVGSPMALNGVTVTVVTADLNAKPGNEFITPKAGNRFVAVQILYEDTGTENYDYNPYDWKLSDSDGFSYNTTFSEIGPELHSGTLQPGEKARGFMTFEVPKSATGLVLKLTSGDDSAKVALGA